MNALLKPNLATPLLLLLALGACQTMDSLNPFSDPPPKEEVSALPPEELYSRGMDALSRGNDSTAATQFDNVEQNYPYSPWAVNAQLMAGYSDYKQNHYTDAIGTLDRFIQLHPAHHDIAYAYYLRALCYYEQIADIQRDQKGTQDALAALQEVVNRFPETAYGRDARLKIDLAHDHLAGKEMEIGRWYESQHLYTAAIGRFQRVIDDYQTTNHVPEIYLTLGLTDQARHTAAVLAHNYPGSRWYEDSYNELVTGGVVKDATPVAQRPGFFARTLDSIF